MGNSGVGDGGVAGGGGAEAEAGVAPQARAGDGLVSYSGQGVWWDGRQVVWRMNRTWADVVAGTSDPVARTLSALSSTVRLRIVSELAHGPLGTGELSERLDQASAGQLFHHLRELLAVGLVHQPRRGEYALRPQHVLPMLAVLSAAIDLSPSDPGTDS